MKKLFIALTITLSAMASDTIPTQFPLIENDIALEAIKEGEVVSQRLLCEDHSCVINGTVVTIKLPLGGCLDRLGPVTASATQLRGKILLNLTAINVANSDSFAAFCFKMPEDFVEITLIDKYGVVELNFLKPIQ